LRDLLQFEANVPAAQADGRLASLVVVALTIAKKNPGRAK
jgi:hypothetical protein